MSSPNHCFQDSYDALVPLEENGKIPLRDEEDDDYCRAFLAPPSMILQGQRVLYLSLWITQVPRKISMIISYHAKLKRLSVWINQNQFFMQVQNNMKNILSTKFMKIKNKMKTHLNSHSPLKRVLKTWLMKM